MWLEHMQEKIIRVREKLGISRVAFSKAAGISNSQMRRIEAGAAVLEEQTLQKICETYHVDVNNHAIFRTSNHSIFESHIH